MRGTEALRPAGTGGLRQRLEHGGGARQREEAAPDRRRQGVLLRRQRGQVRGEAQAGRVDRRALARRQGKTAEPGGHRVITDLHRGGSVP